MAAIKSWFKGRNGDHEENLSVDDLLALGRVDEAETRLRAVLRSNSRDLHSRLKLADLLLRQERRSEALQEYFSVADGHAREGFYKKARALLHKLDRLVPGNDKVRQKISGLERMRNVERRRDLVIGGLLQNRESGSESVSAFELQKSWLDLATNPLMERLSDSQLQRLFKAFKLRRLRESATVVPAGAQTAAIFLIASGEVAAQAIMASGKRTAIRTFNAGDLIGDRALLEHQPWPAEYIATKESTLLVLTRERLGLAMVGETDPKGFLDALRAQRHDHDVAAALVNLKEGE